jgi:hypothetical protein
LRPAASLLLGRRGAGFFCAVPGEPCALGIVIMAHPVAAVGVIAGHVYMAAADGHEPSQMISTGCRLGWQLGWA